MTFHSDLEQELSDLLILALPYLETAVADPLYKQAGLTQLINRIESTLKETT